MPIRLARVVRVCTAAPRLLNLAPAHRISPAAETLALSRPRVRRRNIACNLPLDRFLAKYPTPS